LLVVATLKTKTSTYTQPGVAMDNEQFKRYNLVRQTISRDQIVDFVNELHRVQHDMIEMLVASKERQGFPEAVTLIKHIQGLR